MLVGAGVGCGDDTTTATGNDMAVGNDLSMPAMHDMKQLTCKDIFTCAASGGTAGALAACTAEGTTASKQAAGALVQCAAGACVGDGGTPDTTCVSQTLVQALGFTGQAPAGPCMSQGTACLSAM